MKNFNFKSFISGFLCCLLLVGVATPAFAATSKALTAYYNNIKIVVNDKTVVPTDVNGNVVEPFIVNGTTYLPVRAISQALGQDVNWDGKTATVYVGDYNAAAKNLIDDIGAYYVSQMPTVEVYTSNGDSTFSAYNKTYKCGIVFKNMWQMPSSEADFNLEGKYSTLTIQMANSNDPSTTDTVYFYGDNDTLLEQVSLVGGELPKDITVDVTGVYQLKIKVNGDYSAFAINAFVE